jgi:hypothetical protein
MVWYQLKSGVSLCNSNLLSTAINTNWSTALGVKLISTLLGFVISVHKVIVYAIAEL